MEEEKNVNTTNEETEEYIEVVGDTEEVYNEVEEDVE